jgi:hypothetical protein
VSYPRISNLILGYDTVKSDEINHFFGGTYCLNIQGRREEKINSKNLGRRFF